MSDKEIKIETFIDEDDKRTVYVVPVSTEVLMALAKAFGVPDPTDGVLPNRERGFVFQWDGKKAKDVG